MFLEEGIKVGVGGATTTVATNVVAFNTVTSTSTTNVNFIGSNTLLRTRPGVRGIRLSVEATTRGTRRGFGDHDTNGDSRRGRRVTRRVRHSVTTGREATVRPVLRSVHGTVRRIHRRGKLSIVLRTNTIVSNNASMASRINTGLAGWSWGRGRTFQNLFFI